MSNVNAAGNYPRPVPGGYVIRIESVQNNIAKEKLEIEFDIDGGEFAGYYKDMKTRLGWSSGKFAKSYKQKALPFFRAFIEAVQASNEDTTGLVIGDFEDIDETKLVGKSVGVVVGEREYDGGDGLRKKGLDWYNATFVTIDDIIKGNYEVPELRITGTKATVTESTGVVDMSSNYLGPVSDTDVPF